MLREMSKEFFRANMRKPFNDEIKQMLALWLLDNDISELIVTQHVEPDLIRLMGDILVFQASEISFPIDKLMKCFAGDDKLVRR